MCPFAQQYEIFAHAHYLLLELHAHYLWLELCPLSAAGNPDTEAFPVFLTGWCNALDSRVESRYVASHRGQLVGDVKCSARPAQAVPLSPL